MNASAANSETPSRWNRGGEETQNAQKFGKHDASGHSPESAVSRYRLSQSSMILRIAFSSASLIADVPFDTERCELCAFPAPPVSLAPGAAEAATLGWAGELLVTRGVTPPRPDVPAGAMRAAAALRRSAEPVSSQKSSSSSERKRERSGEENSTAKRAFSSRSRSAADMACLSVAGTYKLRDEMALKSTEQ